MSGSGNPTIMAGIFAQAFAGHPPTFQVIGVKEPSLARLSARGRGCCGRPTWLVIELPRVPRCTDSPNARSITFGSTGERNLGRFQENSAQAWSRQALCCWLSSAGQLQDLPGSWKNPSRAFAPLWDPGQFIGLAFSAPTMQSTLCVQ